MPAPSCFLGWRIGEEAHPVVIHRSNVTRIGHWVARELGTCLVEPNMPESTTASQEELKANRVPLGWRDGCSALLIPLNLCRKEHLYLPWACEHEKHAYEKCQYDDYLRRMKALVKQTNTKNEQ